MEVKQNETIWYQPYAETPGVVERTLATVYDGVFAVHKQGEKWRVTHAPSGLFFGAFEHERHANMFVRLLYERKLINLETLKGDSFESARAGIKVREARQLLEVISEFGDVYQA